MAENAERELIHKLYIRVCRDSGFQLDLHRACSLVARILGKHPLEVWMAFPSLDVMFAIAAGDHPSLDNPRYSTAATTSPVLQPQSRPALANQEVI